jgi:catechol 2,3-dioxygenase-like lactoylglutathione lyase family enzyme
MMQQHLHIITLGVNDLEASKKFYSETLGWTISSPQEGIAFFQAGGVVLALFPAKNWQRTPWFLSKEVAFRESPSHIMREVSQK